MSLVRYYEDKRRYADLINGFLFHGEQVVEESDIKETDSRDVGVKEDSEKKGKQLIQIYRDMVRKIVFGTNVIMIAIENQDEIHYAMPVRILYGDALAYHNQVKRIQKHHREQKDWESTAEFLGKFYGKDQLYAVISLVLYYGEKPWDGAEDLYDLLNLDDIPEEMRGFINHYPIHILDVHRFEHTEWFRTDVREVFEFIQCSEDKEKLKEFVEKRKDRLANMEEDACEVIEMIAKTKVTSFKKAKYRNKEGGIDMCKGLEDWGKELEEIGRQRGIQMASTALFQYGMSAEEFAMKYQVAVEVVKGWYDEWAEEALTTG